MFEPHPPLLQSSSIIARVDIWLSITSRQTSFIASLHHPSSSTVIASMASHSQPMPLPIRTNTVDSQKSQSSSGQISPPYSPASPNSRLATSPTEESFFGAITARIRGRSRSRSRGATPDKRTKSPMAMPPVRPSHARHTSAASSSSPARPLATPLQGGRPSIQDTGRRNTSGSDPWRGRHSNDWLFNGYSVTASAKEFIQRRK
jgi:hypothetical protein